MSECEFRVIKRHDPKPKYKELSKEGLNFANAYLAIIEWKMLLVNKGARIPQEEIIEFAVKFADALKGKIKKNPEFSVGDFVGTKSPSR